MNAASIPSGCSFGQQMVDQTPRFDSRRKGKFSSNQVVSKRGIIRKDRRKKVRYL